MSADLMVFEKSKTPTEPLDFLKWYYEKTEWNSDRDYFDIKGTSEPLVNFFMEIKEIFPEMNGPFAPSEEDLENNPELEFRLTDYTIDDDLIYMGFAWSHAEEAEKIVEKLAFKHGLGYFDMFTLRFDENTSIPVPQISKEELLIKVNKTDKKKKSFLSKLFGK